MDSRETLPLPEPLPDENCLRAMHKLLADQLTRVTGETTGEVDFDRLLELVDAAYTEYDRDLVQTGRSMSFMIDELGTTHRRVLDAIDAIPAAISLFDADDRFVLWNKRYATSAPGVRARTRCWHAFWRHVAGGNLRRLCSRRARPRRRMDREANCRPQVAARTRKFSNSTTVAI